MLVKHDNTFDNPRQVPISGFERLQSCFKQINAQVCSSEGISMNKSFHTHDR